MTEIIVPSGLPPWCSCSAANGQTLAANSTVLSLLNVAFHTNAPDHYALDAASPQGIKFLKVGTYKLELGFQCRATVAHPITSPTTKGCVGELNTTPGVWSQLPGTIASAFGGGTGGTTSAIWQMMTTVLVGIDPDSVGQSATLMIDNATGATMGALQFADILITKLGNGYA